MNHKLISVGIGGLLIIGIGSMVFSTSSARNTVPAPASGVQATSSGVTPAAEVVATTTGMVTPPKQGIAVGEPNPSAPAPTPSGITTEEVAQHNSRESCWSTINGNVYDLTSWIPKHPGGEQAILQLCGTDGSAKFNNKHGGASRQAAILAGFKIGAAAQ